MKEHLERYSENLGVIPIGAPSLKVMKIQTSRRDKSEGFVPESDQPGKNGNSRTWMFLLSAFLIVLSMFAVGPANAQTGNVPTRTAESSGDGNANREAAVKIDPKKTAMLTLDVQQGILEMFPDAKAVIPNAQKAVEFARKNGIKVIHVGVGFSEGHPEAPDFDPLFIRLKRENLFVRGSASAEFSRPLVKPGDWIVYKQRIGAFPGSSLQHILRSQGIERLVIFGVATNGIVLSTVREGYDLDYRITVLSDACYDPDPEVHRVLTEKVFPAQAKVTTVNNFIAEQEAFINKNIQ